MIRMESPRRAQNDGDEPPIQLAQAEPTFFRAARRRDGIKRPAVKQYLGVDEVKPAGFQHGDALGLRPLKIRPTDDIPTIVDIIKMSAGR